MYDIRHGRNSTFESVFLFFVGECDKTRGTRDRNAAAQSDVIFPSKLIVKAELQRMKCVKCRGKLNIIAIASKIADRQSETEKTKWCVGDAAGISVCKFNF